MTIGHFVLRDTSIVTWLFVGEWRAKAYFKGREPWEYDDDQLAVLCNACHQDISEQNPDILAEVCSRLPQVNRRQIGCMLLAMFLDGATIRQADWRLLRNIRTADVLELREKWDEVYLTAIKELDKEEAGHPCPTNTDRPVGFVRGAAPARTLRESP